jgi:hypothetical protein
VSGAGQTAGDAASGDRLEVASSGVLASSGAFELASWGAPASLAVSGSSDAQLTKRNDEQTKAFDRVRRSMRPSVSATLIFVNLK